jgi:hypothetical protein
MALGAIRRLASRSPVKLNPKKHQPLVGLVLEVATKFA